MTDAILIDKFNVPICLFCNHYMNNESIYIFRCHTCRMEAYIDESHKPKWIRLECNIEDDKYAISLDYQSNQTGIHYYPCLQNLPEHKKLEYISGKINPSILWIKQLVKDVNPWNVKEKIKFLLTYS